VTFDEAIIEGAYTATGEAMWAVDWFSINKYSHHNYFVYIHVILFRLTADQIEATPVAGARPRRRRGPRAAAYRDRRGHRRAEDDLFRHPEEPIMSRKRNQPGIPPSRRNQPGDWRERLRATTRRAAAKMRGDFEFNDASTRRYLIAGVRLALGEAATADLDSLIASAGGEPDDLVRSIARFYRTLIDGDGIARDEPIIAESFMAVVETALDDMGLGWRTKVRNATQILISGLMKSRDGDVAAVRRAIVEAAELALSDRPSEDMVELIEAPETFGNPDVTLDLAVSKAGVFRMVIDIEGLPRHDRATDRLFLDEVRSVLDSHIPEAA
jgi:hypothetical protein